MSNIDWAAIGFDLASMSPGGETDARIEQMVQSALEVGSPNAVSVLIQALGIAEHAVVKQRVAVALAEIAPDDDELSVNALIEVMQHCSDDFLYIEIFKAVGLLARRNAFAHADILRILLRLKVTQSPFLLIAAAKIIGQLEVIQHTRKLREKLTEFENSSDPNVQAEVWQQRALLALADALLADERVELQKHLQTARLLFLRAEASEENREDASAFALLLDLVLEFFQLNNQNRVVIADRIAEKSVALSYVVNNPSSQWWYGYRSTVEQLLMFRIHQIAASFQKIAESVTQLEEWTNFDEALVNLAAVYTVMLDKQRQSLSRLDQALSTLGPAVASPRLGSLLMDAVTRVRFEKVIERYIAAHGNNDTAQGLYSIYEEGLKSGYTSETSIDSGLLARLTAAAEAAGEAPDFFIKEICHALESNDIVSWAKKYKYPSLPLSIDHPGLLGNDPQIDQAARTLLDLIANQLQTYPPQQWRRLIDVCIALIQIVQQIRDDLPPYTLAEGEDKGKDKPGKGQQANESDLQRDLFNRLRLIFGRSAGYEVTSVGGGRSDTGLKFVDCEFPIEVKAEYKTIDRQHVHSYYMSQVDTYASVRDRVAFLIVLDLRAANAGHQNKKPSTRKGSQRVEVDESYKHYSLYSLTHSFWVDGLSVDPYIQNAPKNAVVVGLVPGNRLKPSSMTEYSRKP